MAAATLYHTKRVIHLQHTADMLAAQNNYTAVYSSFDNKHLLFHLLIYLAMHNTPILTQESFVQTAVCHRVRCLLSEIHRVL